MGNKISRSEARELLENWEKPGAPGKTMGANYKDSYETYFTVKELRAYLDYIESNVTDNPGVRIYFGSYGTGPGVGNKNGISTVFLAPTKGGKIEGSEDADLDNVENVYSLDAYNSGGTKYPPAEYK